jgi:hypothetical protein
MNLAVRRRQGEIRRRRAENDIGGACGHVSSSG